MSDLNLDSLVSPYSPHVQSHVSTSVHTLKIPSTVSHVPLFGHMKILHSLVGMGSAALVAAVPKPGMATCISHKGQ